MSHRIPKTVLLLALAAAAGPVGQRIRADDRQPFGCADRPRTDLSGDPLPDGAIARLGTVRLRHGHLISGAVVSGDGRTIIASDYFSGVHVWDIATGKELRRFFSDDNYCHRLTLSPDGKTLAVADGNLVVRLCDPVTGREFAALPKQQDRLSDMVFSTDGSLLAIGTGHQAVRIYDVATQRLVREVTFPVQVSDLAFAPGDKLLAASGQDGSCRLWDLARNVEVRPLRDGADGKPPLRPAYSVRGDLLAVSGYTDGSIRLFTADGVKEVRRLEGSPIDRKTPPKEPEPTPIAFSPDGKVLAARRDRTRIDLWNAETGRRLHTLVAASYRGPTLLAFSPDGRKLLSVGGDFWGGDNVIHLWDVTEGKELLPYPGHGAPVSSVAVSPDGKTVATAGREGVVHLWDRSGRHLARLDGPRGRRTEVAFSTDGRRLTAWAAFRGDGTLWIWDARTRQLVSRLDPPGPDAFWGAVSDDGRTAGSVDFQAKIVRFHDLPTGRIVRQVPDDFHRPVALTPAGDKFVGLDGTLMTVTDRKELAHFEHISASHTRIQFSADARVFIAAAPARRELDLRSNPPSEEIIVIDPVAGRKVRQFGERDGTYYPIEASTLSADGKTVVTVGPLGTRWSDARVVTLWETETGRERGRFVGHPWPATSVALSADGRFIVTGSEDTTAVVWDATRPSHPRGMTFARPADCLRALALEDAERAYAAIWALVDTPKETVSFLEGQKNLFAPTDVPQIRRWIGDLDSDKFADRERASRELGMILDEAEAHLRKAILDKPSAEARRRIDLLLQVRSTGMTGKELQKFRLIEALERLATPPADASPGPDPSRLGAVALLQKLADAAPESRLSREAKAALGRVK
jgi:WD40 repeat protein